MGNTGADSTAFVAVPFTPDVALAHKVLIVDDDDATRSGVQKLLQRAGFEAVATSTFEDGRRALKDGSFDLLIADVRLGAFNGLQLIATSPRAMAPRRTSGVIASTVTSAARKASANPGVTVGTCITVASIAANARESD